MRAWWLVDHHELIMICMQLVYNIENKKYVLLIIIIYSSQLFHIHFNFYYSRARVPYATYAVQTRKIDVAD